MYSSNCFYSSLSRKLTTSGAVVLSTVMEVHAYYLLANLHDIWQLLSRPSSHFCRFACDNLKAILHKYSRHRCTQDNHHRKINTVRALVCLERSSNTSSAIASHRPHLRGHRLPCLTWSIEYASASRTTFPNWTSLAPPSAEPSSSSSSTYSILLGRGRRCRPHKAPFKPPPRWPWQSPPLQHPQQGSAPLVGAYQQQASALQRSSPATAPTARAGALWGCRLQPRLRQWSRGRVRHAGHTHAACFQACVASAAAPGPSDNRRAGRRTPTPGRLVRAMCRSGD